MRSWIAAGRPSEANTEPCPTHGPGPHGFDLPARKPKHFLRCAWSFAALARKLYLRGLAAKAQAPVVVTDKAKLSPTVGTAVFRLGHGALSSIRGQPRHALRSGWRRILPSGW